MFCCMSILALQSSWLGRESWLLCLICLPGVSWWLSGSSSRCHGVVCGLWLWYFLIILTYYFLKACKFDQSMLQSHPADKVRKMAWQRSGIDKIRYQTWPRIPYGKVTKHNFTSQTRDKRSALSSRWPQGSNEQTQKHDKHKTWIAQIIHKRSTILELSYKYFTGWPNWFHGASLTLSSDVDQDT